MWKYAVCSATSTSTRCARFPANASGASGSGNPPAIGRRCGSVLVAVVIDQNDDPLELGQDVEEVPADELRFWSAICGGRSG